MDHNYVSCVCSPTRAQVRRARGRRPLQVRVALGAWAKRGRPALFFAQFLTGQYAMRAGFGFGVLAPMNSRGTLPMDVPTVAESLQRVGYDTAMIGKW